ncbi:MAG: PD40 domain-containing protein [Anaerolineae bacterium]|nr:PD40 domain-containing protein [Anaerolineae bacterium]
MVRHSRMGVFASLGTLVVVIALAVACSSGSSKNVIEISPSQLRPEMGQQRIVLDSNTPGDDYLYLLTVDGSEFITLTSTIGAPSSPALSPDGSQIVYECGIGFTDLCLMNVQTGEQTRLVEISRQLSGAVAAMRPAFSPDGQQVVFTGGFSDAIGLFVINVDGSDLEPIGEGAYSHYASYSPDGKQIIFECEGSQGNPPQICVMNADGTGKKRLTDANRMYSMPRFTPDGNHIFVSSCQNSLFWDTLGLGDQYKVHIMNADGSDFRQFISDEPSGVVTFSSDGKEIVYRVADKDTGITTDLYVINIDGSDKRRLGDDWWDVARKGGGLPQ